MQFRLVRVMNPILILSCSFSIQGGNPIYMISFKNKLMLACIQTDFFQTWHDDKDHYALHFDVSLDDLDLHSRA